MTDRKRPALGATTLVQQAPMPQQNYSSQPLAPNDNNFGEFDFANNMQIPQDYSDPSAYENNNFAYGLNNSQVPTQARPAPVPAPSTELVRRNRNQQLAPLNGQQEQWNSAGIMHGPVEDEDEHALKLKVAEAKQEAQGKRKQIPPFVQKLSSFLDSNNTDLIRWSDDGRSFIVLDEDEFARTLIPELFKHNNYASFVRQLNMYGFHKTVNITDGSLRQSEKARKGVKPPSMYSHPYFRKNQPDLLWLIQKPTTKSNAKRKRGEDGVKDQYDSDDDRQSPVGDGRPHELSVPGASQDLAQMPRNELVAVRQELRNLQQQQKFISQMITQLKEQNDQFYRQASAFQTLHDRHENSINAILSFLATFYNRSLDGQNAQNLVNMFTNATQNQQHGSVVEEFPDMPANVTNQVQRYKRPPLLLPGPQVNTATQGSIETEPNSARASVTPPNPGSARDNRPSARPDARRSASAMTSSPAPKQEMPTPNVLDQIPESSDDMMNIINSVNATTANTPGTAAPAVDFNSIVDHFNNNSNTPLTPQQRDSVLASMSRQGDSADGTFKNALTTSSQPFDFTQLGNSRDVLQHLEKMQTEQNAKVNELNRRLQPLSPSGSIPGLDLPTSDPFDNLPPGSYDVADQFLNYDGTSHDFDEDNWDFDGFANDGSDMFGNVPADASRLAPEQADGAGRVESVSSEAPSPAPAGDISAVSEEPGIPKKRTRRS